MCLLMILLCELHTLCCGWCDSGHQISGASQGEGLREAVGKHSVCLFFLSLPLSLSLVTAKLERSLRHAHVHPRQLLGPMQGWPPRLLLVCLGARGGIAYQSMGQIFTQAGMLPHCIWDVSQPQR